MNRFKVLLNSYISLILVLLDTDMSKILIIGNFLGQQADKKRDGDVRNGNEMVTGMKAKYTQKIYKIPILLAYVKTKQ